VVHVLELKAVLETILPDVDEKQVIFWLSIIDVNANGFIDLVEY